MAKGRSALDSSNSDDELSYSLVEWDTTVDRRDSSERQLGLTFALVYAKYGVTKQELFNSLPGYRWPERSEVALNKLFERDKADIRALGVPIETIVPQDGDNQETRYRIPMAAFQWPERVSFSPKQISLIELAVKCWSDASLYPELDAALTRLKSLGVRPTGPQVYEFVPKFRVHDALFTQLNEAISERAPITFKYLKPEAKSPELRSLQPWKLHSVDGQWLVQGFDTQRQATRSFLLKRIIGKSLNLELNPDSQFAHPSAQELKAIDEKLAAFIAQNVATIAVVPNSAAWSHFEMDIRSEDGATLAFQFMDEDLLASTLRSFAGQVEVLSPVSLNQKFESGLAKVAQLHA